MNRPGPNLKARDLLIKPSEASMRLDHYLVRLHLPRSRTFLQRLIKEGVITVNDRAVKPNHTLQAGDRVRLMMPEPKKIEVVAQAIPLDVLYEDRHIVVINKPAGLVVHPAPGNYDRTLVNALLYHCKDLSEIGGRERPGIVHRLDKDTSGIMVIAKTDAAHRALSRQFKEHTIRRVYTALVLGVLKKRKGTISLAIGRDVRDRKRISHRTHSPKEAVTDYRVIERFKDGSWVEALPQTGRTHQIRVHFASIGHPVLGDRTYGGSRVSQIDEAPVPRQMLHARVLGFTHPATGERRDFTAPLPPDFEECLLRLSSLPE
jgi:23S rRNA pseudouridine1911/1915/1917 synthase